MGNRPRPPEHLYGTQALLDTPMFEPATDLLGWIRETFLSEESPLHNSEHGHLCVASIGVLWTNVRYDRRGKRVLGQAEFKPPSGTMGKWARARAQSQLIGWFRELPDFLITLEAQYAAEASDAAFCALVEHELFHCGQEQDEFGGPKFSKTSGLPVFALRAHDIEEFAGVVTRYGVVTKELQDFAEALASGPLVPADAIAGCCGTCGR